MGWKPKAWPAEVGEDYGDMVEALESAGKIKDVLCKEAIEPRDRMLVYKLGPILTDRIIQALESAKNIVAYPSRIRGRPAKWLTNTEDIIAALLTVLELTDQLEESVRLNNWHTVKACCIACTAKMKSISEILGSHPYRPPDAVDQANEIAEQAFKR